MKLNVDFGKILSTLIGLGILAIIGAVVDLQVLKASVANDRKVSVESRQMINEIKKKVDIIYWQNIESKNINIPERFR